MVRARMYYRNHYYLYHLSDVYVSHGKLVYFQKQNAILRHPNKSNGKVFVGECDLFHNYVHYTCNKETTSAILSGIGWWKYGDYFNVIIPQLMLVLMKFYPSQ